MDKTLRKYTSFDEAKADEYRYWQSRPAHERMAAVSEITRELYAMKGAVPNVPRLQRSLVHLKRPHRSPSASGVKCSQREDPMSPAVEKILAEINSLAPVEQQEIRKLLAQNPTSASRPTPQLVDKIKGKYSFVATSSEAFAARKQEEIDLENQHNGKRR